MKLNREGMSILIVTHDAKVASCCDRVCYMMDGKISGEIIFGKYQEQNKKERETKMNHWLEGNGW